MTTPPLSRNSHYGLYCLWMQQTYLCVYQANAFAHVCAVLHSRPDNRYTHLIAKSKLTVAGVSADGQFYCQDLLFNDVFDLVLAAWILNWILCFICFGCHDRFANTMLKEGVTHITQNYLKIKIKKILKVNFFSSF